MHSFLLLYAPSRLQLPPFLLTTTKANRSQSSPFPPAQDELSNRMYKQAKLNQNKPSLLHLNKIKQNKQKLWTVRTCCSKHASLDLFSDLKGCSLLSSKDTSLIDCGLHARNSAFFLFFPFKKFRQVDLPSRKICSAAEMGRETFVPIPLATGYPSMQ